MFSICTHRTPTSNHDTLPCINRILGALHLQDHIPLPSRLSLVGPAFLCQARAHVIITELQGFASTPSAQLRAGSTRDVKFLGFLDDAVFPWVLLGEEARDGVGENVLHTTQL